MGAAFTGLLPTVVVLGICCVFSVVMYIFSVLYDYTEVAPAWLGIKQSKVWSVIFYMLYCLFALGGCMAYLRILEIISTPGI